MTSIAKTVLTVLAFATMNTGVAADEYPSHPIRLIAASAAGGVTDTVARLITDALGRQLGQPVVIDNRAGAGGVIGTEAAAQARPDGYTLLAGAAAVFTVIPAVKKTSYDTTKDFVPLGQIWSAPQALVLGPKLGIKTVAELVAYAKANPGKLTFASAGNGSTTHLSIVLLSREAGIDVIHVPYKSGGQSRTSVLSGLVDGVFHDVSGAAPLVRAGKLAALAVTGPQRSSLLPNVPTMAEAGLPGVRMVNWFGLFAIAGTPPAVLDRLKAAVRAAQLDPAYLALLAKNANTTGTVGAEAFAEMVQEEAKRLAPIVRSSGIRFD